TTWARRGGTERVKMASVRSRASVGTVKLTVVPSRPAQPSTKIIPLGVSRAPYKNAPSPGCSTSFVSSPWKQVTAPGPWSETTATGARAATAPVRSAATSRERPASVERRARGQIARRVGLAAGHVLRGQDHLEVGPKPGTVEHGLDLAPPRAAHEPQPEPLGGARHEVRDPGHQAEGLI